MISVNFNRRILKEIKLLKEEKETQSCLQNTNIKNINYREDDKNIIVEIDNKFKFVLSRNYPFNPPELFINGLNYITMLQQSHSFVNAKLSEKGIACLCCESILCKNNWNVTNTMKNILEEYKRNQILLLSIYKQRYVPEICSKYEIDCYELIEMIQGFIRSH